ncbi:MAG: MFS transporter [Chloroflexi bacterium]|nr:MFS transporter [Chloroflexota bacterium]
MAGRTKNSVNDQGGVPDPDKLDFKRILPIFVIVLVDLLGMTIIIPLLPLYAASFGANALVVGLLGATYPVMQFIGAPLLGRLSDRYGRKPILLVSQFGTLAGFILMGVSGSLWLLFVARLIDGLSGANISTAQAAITDSTTEKNRTQALGLIGAAFGIGFTIGPVIAFASLALSGNNYHTPAFVAAGFSFASILLTAFWFKETLPAERRGRGGHKAEVSFGAMAKAIVHPQVGFLLALMFVQQFAFGGFENLFSLFSLSRLGLNAAGNSIIFVFLGVVITIVQGGLIGPWSRKHGDRWLIYMGLATLAIGLILVAVTPAQAVPWYSRQNITSELTASRPLPDELSAAKSVQIPLPDQTNTGWLGLAWLAVALLPATVGGGVLSPSINSAITKRVLSTEVGGMLGLSAAFVSVANAFAPLIFGAVFQVFGSTAPFLLGGLLIAVMWLLARRSIPERKQVQSSPAAAVAPSMPSH